ncbi:MAG: hypothetical protein Q9222_007431 [Ikaeria aurantiellina]
MALSVATAQSGFTAIEKSTIGESQFRTTMEHQTGSKPQHHSTTPAEPALEKPFPLMKLPLELRTMIYKEALVAPDGLDIAFEMGQWHSHAEKPYLCRCNHSEPRLPTIYKAFHVSVALYNETMPIFFGDNRFIFDNLDYMYDFLTGISPNCRRKIRQISVTFHGRSPAKSIKVLQRCTSLQQLSLRIDPLIRWSRGPAAVSLIKATGINNLLKVRGITNLEVTKTGYWNIDPSDPTDWEELVEAMQILKKPYHPSVLRLQEKKDYPPEKAKRTVFGKTNVRTRSESKQDQQRPA